MTYGELLPGEAHFDKQHWLQDEMLELHKMDALWAYCIRGAAWFHCLNCEEVNDPVLLCLLEMGLVNGRAPDNKYNFLDHYAAIATSCLLERSLVLEKQVKMSDLERRQYTTFVHEGFSRIDANLVALDEQLDCRREVGDKLEGHL